MSARQELLDWVDQSFGDFTVGKPHEVVEQIKEIMWQIELRNVERIAGLERELAEVRKDVWQPIETAPKDGTSILVVMQGYTPAVARWLAGMWMTAEMEGDFEDDDLNACEWNLTHWMPLPAPPAVSVAQANKEQGNGDE